MTAPDLVRLLLLPLHDSGITYMVTGSVAAIAYGEPRMTNDVDIVARLDAESTGRIQRAFPDSSYYLAPPEVIEQERRRDRFGHFNIIHRETALRADVYVAGSDPLHAWAFERRRAESLADRTIWFAPVEYVIVRKLEYHAQSGSDRHLRDIAGIVRVSGENIDTAALQKLLDERGLKPAWERARQS
jgi:hypothetical protein